MERKTSDAAILNCAELLVWPPTQCQAFPFRIKGFLRWKIFTELVFDFYHIRQNLDEHFHQMWVQMMSNDVGKWRTPYHLDFIGISSWIDFNISPE